MMRAPVPTATRPPARPADGRARTTRAVALVMTLQSASLVVASALHLFGHVRGRGEPFDVDRAGVAEAIIAVVLLTAAVSMWRDAASRPARARTVGLVANGFAIVGFLNGLGMTVRGGHLPDIAYHVVLLPVFVANVVVLARNTDGAGSPAG